MPIKEINLVNTETRIGIWKISEEVDELRSICTLKGNEIDSLNSFSNDRRKKEWLAVRCLLSSMNINDQIEYSSNGKPIFLEAGNISISHTKGWATIIINSSVRVGCDIERLSHKVLRIKEKFASENEIKNAIVWNKEIEYYTLIWSAKEAIYKLYSDIEALEFKSKIQVKLPRVNANTGKLYAEVFLEKGKKKIELNYHIEEDYVLVYTLND